MAKYPIGLREEELKLCVAEDWFAVYDCKRRIGNIDFCVAIPATELGLYGSESALWAEAKAGTHKDILESFVQLILTIGRARVFDKEHPPRFLGAFDAEKIAFLPYDTVMDVFAQNDFNWNVTPSDHSTKEFSQLYELAKQTIEGESYLYDYEKDEAELRKFIKANFISGRKDVSRIQITRNNFTHVYQKWRLAVLPSLDVANWDTMRKDGIIDADFFLADVLSDKNKTLRKKLHILLQSDVYEVKYGVTNSGLPLISKVGFNDGQKAHQQFWNHYTRPPRKEYWDFIVERRDLLVDQDIRERKGAFFTPRMWVELSQEYLAKELGDGWQDEYVIWDCCAGTGNLEAGLTNKYRIWASTLDKADVDVMHTRIKMMDERGGANMLDTHVFQFDFLNDSFDKLPKDLKAIVQDPEKRKKLVIYINPPYAEHSNRKVIVGTGENRTNVAKTTRIYHDFSARVGTATRELYVQFFLRIFRDIPGCRLGSFSTLKFVCSQNCKKFRSYWRSSFGRAFICPSDTFDNVKGEFPIAFSIWRLDGGSEVKGMVANIMESDGQYVGDKQFYTSEDKRMISDWLRGYYDPKGETIGYLSLPGVSMQQRSSLFLTLKPTESDVRQHKVTKVTVANLLPCTTYLAVRHCISPHWTNNKDEFRFPLEGWREDREFLGNCLVWSLFDNSIKSADGSNHWIPFTEKDVDAKDCIESHFMSDFLAGKIKAESDDLFGATEQTGVELSPVAHDVLEAGRQLWRHYHAQPKADPNASYYDIRKFFQGVKVDAKGKEKMNSTSEDERYNELLAGLKAAMKKLAAKIVPKVYEYGFLKR